MLIDCKVDADDNRPSLADVGASSDYDVDIHLAQRR